MDALCDIEANVNIMSLTTSLNSNMGPLLPSRTRLILGNRTIKDIVGIIQDVLVIAKHVTLPVDFAVVHVENVDEAPIILGCPFCFTGIALLIVQGKEFKLMMNGEKVKFDVGQVMKQPLEKRLSLE